VRSLLTWARRKLRSALSSYVFMGEAAVPDEVDGEAGAPDPS
jgi:hypothetical protein